MTAYLDAKRELRNLRTPGMLVNSTAAGVETTPSDRDPDNCFFPYDSVRALYSRERVRAVSRCKFDRCKEHLNYIRRKPNMDLSGIVDRIVPVDGESAVALSGLLLYINYPQFIIPFVVQDYNGSSSLQSWSKSFTRATIQQCLRKLKPDELAGPAGSSPVSIRSDFWDAISDAISDHMYRFIVPNIDTSEFTDFHERTILPFYDEEETGEGKVFSFKIYKSSNKLLIVGAAIEFAYPFLADTLGSRADRDAMGWKPIINKRAWRSVAGPLLGLTNIVMLVASAFPLGTKGVPRYYWPVILGVVLTVSLCYWFGLKGLQGRLGKWIGWEAREERVADADDHKRLQGETRRDGIELEVKYTTSGNTKKLKGKLDGVKEFTEKWFW